MKPPSTQAAVPPSVFQTAFLPPKPIILNTTLNSQNIQNGGKNLSNIPPSQEHGGSENKNKNSVYVSSIHETVPFASSSSSSSYPNERESYQLQNKQLNDINLLNGKVKSLQELLEITQVKLKAKEDELLKVQASRGGRPRSNSSVSNQDIEQLVTRSRSSSSASATVYIYILYIHRNYQGYQDYRITNNPCDITGVGYGGRA